MIIGRFAIYALAGFIEIWFLLFFWGFSNGPVDAYPYVALLGCLILLLLAAPLALFLDRIAAAIAIPGALLAAGWTVAAAREGSAVGVVMFSATTRPRAMVTFGSSTRAGRTTGTRRAGFTRSIFLSRSSAFF